MVFSKDVHQQITKKLYWLVPLPSPFAEEVAAATFTLPQSQQRRQPVLQVSPRPPITKRLTTSQSRLLLQTVDLQ